MDLILWRHAEADDAADGQDDMARPLTSRGEKQAARVASWLGRYLPDDTRVLTSPALRCEQTVLTLGRPYKLVDELATAGTVSGLLEVTRWPSAKQPVLVVGHQPYLGQTIAQLIGIKNGGCPIRKGSAWWLHTRAREGRQETVIWSVQSPELI
jgi:phosphohistidine phosphatase